MFPSDVGPSGYNELFLKQTPLIDVRAPVEFAAGHLPGAVNLPLLNDEERAAVGTEYKTRGQAAAIELGHRLVHEERKTARVAAWRAHLNDNPEAVIYCFRGGLRSQISREWIKESGVGRPLIEGGFKAARTFFIERLKSLSAANSYYVVSGPTGSGKTELLLETAAYTPTLNLEALANHRGSAFGAFRTPQPSQVTFENHLAFELMKIAVQYPSRPVVIEDESRMIGKLALQDELFETLRTQPVIMIEENLESRVENIYQEYIVKAGDPAQTLPRYAKAVTAISKKLGGVNTKIVLDLIANNEHHAWIKKLLESYYDPLYRETLRRRDPHFAFRGSRAECREFIRTGLASKF